MYSVGIARKVDELGRVVIPKELRDKYHITKGTPLCVDIDGDCIVFQVYKPECIFCKSTDDVIEYNNRPICKKCIEELRDL